MNITARKARNLFIAVLTCNFLYSAFNFCRGFSERENNLSFAAFSLLHLAPLVALIALCANLPKIEDRKKLSVIQKCLIAYLSADVILGLVTFSFSLPWYIGFPFYSKGWWFSIVYMIKYEQFQLAINLFLDALYWVAFGFLLVEISEAIDLKKESAPLENSLSDEADKGKTSPSFKIAVAVLILLVLQSAFNFYIHLWWNENNNGTGMQAIGLVFLALFLVAIKFVFSLPLLITAIVGIVKASRPKNKALKRNSKGLAINIACLVISEAQVFLWW